MNRWTRAGLLVLALGVSAQAAPVVDVRATSGATGRLVEVLFDPPEFNPAETGTGFEVTLDGAGWIGRPGAPDLPSVQELFELPDRSGVQLRLVEGDWEILPGLDVMPCQERLSTDAELPLPWVRDEVVYSTAEFWPAQAWELGEPALMRNQRVAKASLFPVQVNPVTGEARVWSRMVFELSFAGEDLRNARTYELPARDTSLDRLLERQVVRTATEDGALRDLLFDRGPLPGKYLVFVRSAGATNPYLTALLDWKRKKGHPVVVVTDSQVSFTTTEIRARIATEYQSADPVAFVLLVGDVDGDYNLPTDGTGYDHFYAMIEGDDILGDVAVGRLSVDNAAQLATVCNKILQYESAPYSGNSSWLTHASFQVGSSACYLSMKQLSRGIASELVERRGYSDIDTNFCVDAAQLPSWFNSGISFYNYRGWIGMDGLSNSIITSLAQGPRTPVATIFTCSTGDFDYGDDFTESFLRAGDAATPGGAVACLGFATSSTHTRYNNVVVGGYYGGLLEYDVPEVGACLLQGKYELYRTLPPSEQGNATNFAYWGNLMGDPGTVQWAGALAPLSAAVPATLPAGANHLTLTLTSGGQPVAGVVVCAWQNLATDIQARGLTDENGQVTVAFTGLQPGTLHVTATHRRHVPLLNTVTVSTGTANPALTGVNVGAGLLPNATLQAAALTISNQGSAALTNLNIGTTLDGQYGVLINPGLTLASLAAGASHTFTGLQVAPAQGLPSGTQLPVLLQVGSSQGSYPLLARLPVIAPNLVPGLPSYPVGALEPGSSATVRFNLANLGALAGTELELTFTPQVEDMLTTPGSPLSVGNLALGASTNVDVTMGALSSVNRGQPVPVRVDWTSHHGSLEGSFFIVVTVGGTLSASDPTGPDAYGYWAYENGDNSPLAAEYAWYAISAPEGGPGTEVLLTDDGNEQDAGRWVDLPFAFTYYGQTYTRAAICSNGFLSFDEGGFREWDFRNHVLPSSLGPDAMIAPMWDDHLTTGTSRGVWTWYDSAAHTFVISWYNLAANPSGGPNTFQLVLYDPALYPTLTGDGSFKFQYAVFNDMQSLDTDFPYCTVGFKDESSTRGMTIRHWTQQPTSTSPVAAGRAIYFTTPTGPVEDTHPPSLLVTPVGIVFAGETVTVQAAITDYSGVASATLNWRLANGSWNAVPMTQLVNYWTAQIPGQSIGAQVEYNVSAVDASEYANSGTSVLFTYSVHTLVFVEGFNGVSTFTHEGGGGLTDQWHLESARANEGSQSWKFGGADTLDYSNSAGGILTSPVITLPPGSAQIRASLQSWIQGETSSFYPDSCYDGALIQWRLNGGEWIDAAINPPLTHNLRWTAATAALRAWLGFPRMLFSGDSAGWAPITLNVPDGTTSVQVRLLFGSDTGTAREGWYVDDFRLTAVLPQGALPTVDDLSIATANNQIYLSWSAVPGALAYRIYESTGAYDGVPVQVGETSTPALQLPQSGARKFYTVLVVY